MDVAEGVGSANRYEPRTYYAFCPRVILSTKALGSQPLRTRCIRLDLVKIPSADQAKLRRSVEDGAVWAYLRDQLYQLQLLRWRDASQARNDVRSDWMGDRAPMGRAFEKWLPLAALATLVSPDAFTIIQQLAAEDSLDQQRDAADRDEAHIIRFTLWLEGKTTYGHTASWNRANSGEVATAAERRVQGQGRP